MKEYNLKFRSEDFKKAYISKSYISEYLSDTSRSGTLVILIICVFASNILIEMLKSGKTGLHYYLLFSVLGIIYFSYSVLKDIKHFNQWVGEITKTGRENEKYANPKVIINENYFYFKSDQQIYKHNFDDLKHINLSAHKIYLMFGDKGYMLPQKAFIDNNFDDFSKEVSSRLMK